MRDYFAKMEPCQVSDVMHEMDHSFDRNHIQMAADRLDLLTMPRPLPNVWLGVSAEDQTRADERIPHLLDTPAAVRFVSCEPLLGPVDFRVPFAGAKVDALRGAMPVMGKLDWIITGGESGPNARPMHPDWARVLRNQCQAAGVPFFFKKWGEWVPECDAPDRADENYDGQSKDYLMDADVGEFHDGKDFITGCLCSEGDDGAAMYRIGKKAAGRLLDGREWNEMPVANPLGDCRQSPAGPASKGDAGG